MNTNSNLHHIIAAYPVNGLGDATHAETAKDSRLSESYVHPSWSAAEPVCRNLVMLVDKSPKEIKLEMKRFWELIDDRDGF